MKRFLLFFIAILTVGILSACDSTTGTNKPVPNSASAQGTSSGAASPSTPATTPSIQDATANNSSTNTNQGHRVVVEPEGFYGDWVVKGLIKTDSVSDLGSADIDQIVGKKITYELNNASFDKYTCKSPFYKKTTLSDKSFIDAHPKVLLANLGIQTDSAVDVQIYTDYQGGAFRKVAGHEFLIKDPNTLILVYHNDFFEVDRVNNDSTANPPSADPATQVLNFTIGTTKASMEVPAKWRDKIRIDENGDSVMFLYKSQSMGDALLFEILQMPDDRWQELNQQGGEGDSGNLYTFLTKQGNVDLVYRTHMHVEDPVEEEYYSVLADFKNAIATTLTLQY